MRIARTAVVIVAMWLLIVGLAITFVGESHAQLRGGNQTDEEAQCSRVRSAGRHRLRGMEQVAKYNKRAECDEAEARCYADCALAYKGDCAPNASISSGACGACFNKCVKARRQCRSGRNLRAAKQTAWAEAIAFMCEQIETAGCPHKKVTGIDEPKLCGPAAEWVQPGQFDFLLQ